MQNSVPSQNPRTGSDEIDIREVFASIGRFFSRIGNGFILMLIRLRRTNIRYKWLIAVCVLIGAAIGFLSQNAFEPYYASQLTITSRYYSSEMLKNAVKELDQLAKEGNHKVLAKKLSISEEQAAAIRSFEATPLTTTKDLIEIENLKQKLTANKDITPAQAEDLVMRLSKEVNSFSIVATVYNLDVLDATEHGLSVFLADNDFISRRVAVEKENLLAIREKLVKEQEQLQNLKVLQSEMYGKLAESSRTGSNNVILGGSETANDPLNIYRQDLEFSKEILKTNERIVLNRAFEIVSGFTPYGTPASLSLKGQLVLGALIGLASAYLIILLISINQALNRFEARHVAEKIYA